MKKALFVALCLVTLTVILSSCHREGCPGRITQAESQDKSC